MDKTELLIKMTKIAQEHIHHYFTDFTAYDIPTIVRTDYKMTFTWIIRNSGTWLFMYVNGKPSEYVELIKSQYEGDKTFKEYTITFDGKEWELTEGVK